MFCFAEVFNYLRPSPPQPPLAITESVVLHAKFCLLREFEAKEGRGANIARHKPTRCVIHSRSPSQLPHPLPGIHEESNNNNYRFEKLRLSFSIYDRISFSFLRVFITLCMTPYMYLFWIYARRSRLDFLFSRFSLEYLLIFFGGVTGGKGVKSHLKQTVFLISFFFFFFQKNGRSHTFY